MFWHWREACRFFFTALHFSGALICFGAGACGLVN